MRLSLKRAPDAAPRKPLRERIAETRARLAGTTERAGRALAVAKILMKPEAPNTAPVERIALMNYATWLHYERQLVCLELYPEAGAGADRLVHMDVAADHFHFPAGRDWRDAPQPSTRAVATLDRLGIGWRADRERSAWSEEIGRVEQDPDPLPHGGPRADAALLEALDDLTRLDAALATLHAAGDQSRDGGTVPGYFDLEDARESAIRKLSCERAVSLNGLRAKAKALLTQSVMNGDAGLLSTITSSLARDLLSARQSALDPRPDPILAAIAECERLEAEADAVERATLAGQDVPSNASDAVMVHLHNVLLKTVPTTARGCQALARFVPAFFERWGSSLDDDAPAAFALIARSPLL